MAVIRIVERQQTVSDAEEISTFLATYGITYERWGAQRNVPADASADAVLQAYGDKIEELKARGGYTAVDVIDVTAATPNLDTMLAKFSREHWHDEDEVRFIVEGRGLFHISPPDGTVFAIEVEAGDLISVPRGTRHWFDLCAERRIRAIRLFQEPSGWTPHYTESGIDANFQPLCFGPSFVRGEVLPRSL
jgi:1,2-dihydroxy-3-keto-5-methylthiopentene dioxygenase